MSRREERLKRRLANAERRRGLRAARRRPRLSHGTVRLLWTGGYGLAFIGIVVACVSNNVLVAGLTLFASVGYHLAAIGWHMRHTQRCTDRSRWCGNSWRVRDDRRPPIL